MKKISRVKNKKGITFALESLIGIILSVIALMLLVQVFASAFLQTPTNEKIAKQNAESIREFVDFSFKKYSSMDDCYTMLRLYNLEGYQFEEEGKNYFYIFGEKNVFGKGLKKGIHIINLENYETFNKNKEKYYNGQIATNFIPFDTNVDFKYDITSDPGFSFDIYFWKVNGLGKDIEFNDINPNYFLLMPQFDYEVGGFAKIDSINSNEHKLIPFVDKEGNTEKLEGFYLGFKPSTKELFLSNNKFSNLILDYKNCFIKDSRTLDQIDFIKNNKERADFINYELIFDFVTENNEKKNFKFVWNVNEIKCPTSEGKNCEDYLGINYNKLNYLDFIEKIRKIHYDKFKDVVGKGESKIIDVKRVKFEDLQNSIDKIKNLNYNYDIEDTFVKKEIKNFDNNNIVESLKEVFGDKVFYNFKKLNKGCIESKCDYAGVKPSGVYYYNQDLKSYGLFNTMLLVKTGKKYYYMGEEITLKTEGFDDTGWSPFRNNFDLFYFDYKTKDGIKTAFVSNSQLNAVYEVEE